MSLGAGHSPTHTLPPIMWRLPSQGAGHSPNSHLVRPPPPITWASPFRRLDRSRTRWLLLGCVLLEGEGPPPEGVTSQGRAPLTQPKEVNLWLNQCWQ